MKIVEKALEVLQNKYGIDGRIYDDKLYLAVWNDELSDTIDVQASNSQVERWASESESFDLTETEKEMILGLVQQAIEDIGLGEMEYLKPLQTIENKLK
tara:strand:- start:1529 stop:1825 length:297 start_codon:yes stop_codon:yes gene_type:complete